MFLLTSPLKDNCNDGLLLEINLFLTFHEHVFLYTFESLQSKTIRRTNKHSQTFGSPHC